MIILSVIIPCFNESESLHLLNEKLKSFSQYDKRKVEFIFVDDGSTDSTYDDLNRIFSWIKDKKIIKHESNLNLGATVRTGVENSSGEYIAAIDADCSYEPIKLWEMLDIISKQQADCISASAVHPRGGFTSYLPFYRKILSQSVCALYNIALISWPLKWYFSYTSIFRIYKSESFKKIKFKSNSFLAMSEIFVRMILNGYKIIDYPAFSNYRQFGQSKAKIKKLIGEHLALIVKIIKSRLGIGSI